MSNFDTWVVARDAIGTIADADVLPIIDDPAGTAATKKVTASDLAAYAAVEGAAMIVVTHGATAGTARPPGAAAVYWIGSVEPTNAETYDLWYDTGA